MESLPTTDTTDAASVTNDAAFQIFDSMNAAGYLTAQKIDILKQLKSALQSEIDGQIRELNKLKQSF